MVFQVFIWLTFLLIAQGEDTGDTDEYGGKYGPHPEETQDLGLFEGDMILPRTRNAIIGDRRLWPKGVVPYLIDSASQYTTREKERIQQAVDDYKKYTCIKFIPRTTEKSYVKIFKGRGCYSAVGRSSSTRSQSLSIGRGCTSKGIIIHEMMHALGFYHEQSRTDRDTYVTIMFANIQKGRENNFRKHDANRIQLLGAPYDYSSIMHYSKYAFSSNRQPTIVPADSNAKIGQRGGLSAVDIYKINKLYKCPNPSTLPPWAFTKFTGKPRVTTPPVKVTTPPIKVTTMPPTQPPIVRPIKEDLYCPFDRNTCNFQQSRSDKFDWTRHRYNTSSSGTGPNGDHTSRKGYYMYIETSSPRVAGDNARLLTPVLDYSQPSCLQFWYNMYGGSIGKLNVMFEGIVGSTFQSDIAIDDVTILPGKCSTKPAVTTKPPVVVTTGTITNGIYKCNFDKDACGFVQDKKDQSDWVRHTMATASRGTGPTSDHTSGKGYYMYIETSTGKVGDKSVMSSQQFSAFNSKTCLSFYYHMYGSTVAALKVMVSDGRNSQIVWTMKGDQGNSWKKAQVTIDMNSYKKVLFEATKGTSFRSDIAIDDFMLYKGPCAGGSVG